METTPRIEQDRQDRIATRQELETRFQALPGYDPFDAYRMATEIVYCRPAAAAPHPIH